MYEFDNVINRSLTNSVKWQEKDIIPLWIADMDFSFPKEVKDSLLKLINEGVLGYTYIPDSCYASIISFYNEIYQTKLVKDNILFTTGVIASLGAILAAFLQPGEEVLFLTPCYNTFYNVVEKEGFKVVESPLIYVNNEYSIDYKDLKNKLSRPNMQVLILCNPHNPIGKIWTPEELDIISKMCKEANVLVISDEIHGLLTLPGLKYHSFLNYDENCIVLASPSKPFNMAGLKVGFSLCYNKEINRRLNLAYNRFGITSVNSFAIRLIPTLYSDCREWLNELREYIKNNYEVTKQFIIDNNLNIKIIYGGGTYLLWLDVSYYSSNSLKLSKFLKEKYLVFVAEGSKYLGNGNDFLRLNIATSKNVLLEGLKRLRDGLITYKNINK